MTFLGVGVVTAIVDITLLHLLSEAGMHVVLAATIGFAAAFLVNFSLHLRVTFTAKWQRQTIWRYSFVVALNYGITVGLVALSQELLGSPLPGKFVSLPVVTAIGFPLSKHWVFK